MVDREVGGGEGILGRGRTGARVGRGWGGFLFGVYIWDHLGGFFVFVDEKLPTLLEDFTYKRV